MKKSILLVLLALMVLLGACTAGIEDAPLPETDILQSEVTQDTQAYSQPEQLSGSAAIIDAAYGLAPGERLDGIQTLTGTITAIDTPYSTKYKNISVVIAVAGSEDQPILCFRLEGEGCPGRSGNGTLRGTSFPVPPYPFHSDR